MHRIRGRLTYSNVMVTILALIVLGGGTAYAASEMLPKESVGTHQLKKEAVTPSKLSKTSKAALTGPQGPKGATGATGQPGTPGAPGAPGAPGTALAFAEIGPTGTVSHAKNISQANVAHVGQSLSCISGLSFTPQNVVATSSSYAQPDVTATLGQYSLCPAGTQVTIATYEASGTAAAGPVEVLIN